MPDVRLGALCWNQYTDWPSLLDAGMRAETLGYDDDSVVLTAEGPGRCD